ncbi:MAG TPA: trimethylamine methyltransferase family protein [Clostridia bacterium]|nr:trimethylamine methyltransferase family protein [Clostridia bacterium]
MEQLPVETYRPLMRILSDEQVKSIHRHAMEVMTDIGMQVQDEEAVQILRDAGAVVEKDSWVKIPEFMVQDALNSAPSRVVLANQKGERVLFLEEGKTYFGTGSDTIFTIDPKTRERRRVVIEDVGNFALVGDALPNIHFIMSMGNPEGVSADRVYVQEFAEMVKNSNKPIIFCSQDGTDTELIWEIALSVYGGDVQRLEQNPFMLHYIEPISPLIFPKTSVDKLMASTRHNIPICFTSGANTGGGAPVTMAGGLVMGVAESFFGLVLQQLVRKGAPFVFGPNVSAMDLRTMIVSYGCPEWALTQGALVDLGRYYDLPTWAYAGATDSKSVDAQAGAEATFSIFSALACRCNLVHDVGYIEFGTTSSLEQLVMADEIIDMTRFFMGGIEINSNTLAIDALKRSKNQPAFLTDDHTLKNFRTAQWHPKMIDRRNHDAWEKTGRPTMEDRLNVEVNKILDNYKPEPKSDEVLQRIEELAK